MPRRSSFFIATSLLLAACSGGEEVSLELSAENTTSTSIASGTTTIESEDTSTTSSTSTTSAVEFTAEDAIELYDPYAEDLGNFLATFLRGDDIVEPLEDIMDRLNPVLVTNTPDEVAECYVSQNLSLIHI